MSFPLNSKLPLDDAPKKYSTTYGIIPDKYTSINIAVFLFCSYILVRMTFFEHKLPTFLIVPMSFYLIYICENIRNRWGWWEQVTKLRHYQKEIFPYINEKHQVNLKIRTIRSFEDLVSSQGIQTKNGYTVTLKNTEQYDKMVYEKKSPDKSVIVFSKEKTH